MTHLKGATSTNKRRATIGVINIRHLDSTNESGTSLLKTSGREIIWKSKVGEVSESGVEG